MMIRTTLKIKIYVYLIKMVSIDTTSTLVGFSVGVFVAYIFYNKPECITKMPNTDSCSTLKKMEVPCEEK